MQSRFENLTEVSFRHDFFSNGIFEGLTINLPDNCIYMMRNHGLLFNPLKGGFRILYDTAFAGGDRTRTQILEDSFILNFELQLNTPAFYNYTANLSGPISGSILFFSNVSRDPGVPPAAGTLHQEDAVSDRDRYPADAFQERFFARPFGLIDLKINKALENTYAVHFSARSTFWRYILVGEHLHELQQPAVLDPGGKQVFEGPDPLVLPDGRKALRFTSTGKIALRQRVPLPFQLVEHYEPAEGKYKTIMDALPFPDINIISDAGRRTREDQREDKTGENKTKIDFSEIFIY